MCNFPWTFWRCRSQEKNHTAFSGDCSQVQQLLTAAFDGEAKGEALIQAQRHVAECSHCAQNWAQWEKTRIHLRSVPVPPVPASLLTRILLACRLMPVQDNDYSAFSDHTAHAKLIQYIDAIEDESISAPLSSIMPPVAVPPDLQRRILQATCEAPHARSLSLIAFWRQWMPVAPASRNTVRWGMGLAVPAMAVWAILAAQTENPAQFVQNASDKATTKQEPTSKSNALKVPDFVASAKPVLKPLVKQAAVAVKALPQIASVSAVAEPVDSDENRPLLRRAVDTESSLDSERREAKVVPIASRPAATTVTPRRTRQRTRPAANLIESRSSSFVLAASNQSISRLPLHARPQISHPPVASAPRFARMSESDFDEAFVAVTTARDNRPAEFGLAFDEYRAALLSDTVDTEEETEEL